MSAAVAEVAVEEVEAAVEGRLLAGLGSSDVRLTR